MQETVSNLKIIETIKKVSAKSVLARLRDNKLQPSIRDFIMILDLEERLKGNIGPDANETINSIINIVDPGKRRQLAEDSSKVLDRLLKANRF